VFILTSATLSRSPVIYVAELCFASLLQAINLANVLLIVAALPNETLYRLQSFLNGISGAQEGVARRVARLDLVPLLGAVCVTTLCAALCAWAYEKHPHVADEVVYLYHARYLAAGMLTMPAPPVPEGFDIDLMHYDGDRWYCPVPPGWPALLSLGVRAGAAWLVNPLLAGANVLLAYLLVNRLYDRATARLVVLLMCVSPWNIFMGMNFMTHTSALTFALLACLAMTKLYETGFARWGVLAGAMTGAVSLIRPLEGAALAVFLGVLTLLPLTRPRRHWASLAGLVTGTAIVGGLFPLRFTQRKYSAPARTRSVLVRIEVWDGPGWILYQVTGRLTS
jgi:hypothetical protein